MTQGFAIFKTAIGTAAVAWGPHGIVGSQLPEPTDVEAHAHMRRRFPDATEAPPPSAVQAVIDDIVALMRGEAKDLLGADLDMDGIPDFHRRVYDVARAIPPGETLTYGDVAEKLDAPGAARAVGQALKRNPFAPQVPCHRVVRSDGGLGGYSAAGGLKRKRALLSRERHST